MNPNNLPTNPPKSSNWFVLGGIFFLVTLLIVGGAFYLKNQQSPPTPQQATNSATPSSSNPPSTMAKNGDIKVEVQVESTASGKIKGILTITNTSTQDLADLYYSIFLKTPQTQTDEIIDGRNVTSVHDFKTAYKEPKESFELNSKETKTIPFEIEYSPHLKPGEYTILATVFTNLGNSLGVSLPQKVSLSGTNDMITYDYKTCIVAVSSKEYDPGVAPFIAR